MELLTNRSEFNLYTKAKKKLMYTNKIGNIKHITFSQKI